MKFKVDENLPVEVVGLISDAGHEAETVEEEGLGGADDSEIAVRLQQEQRALITLDLDFSDIRAYAPEDYAGIVVLRAKRQDKISLLSLVRRFLPLLAVEALSGKIWIVEADRVRIR